MSTCWEGSELLLWIAYDFFLFLVPEKRGDTTLAQFSTYAPDDSHAAHVPRETAERTNGRIHANYKVLHRKYVYASYRSIGEKIS